MFENILVGLIIALVAFFVARSFYRTLSGKKGCGCSGSEGSEEGKSPCGGCGCSSACSEKYTDILKEPLSK